MKNTTKLFTLAAVMVIGTAAFAGPGHHHKRDGLDLAYGIVNLVTQVINPNRTVIVPPPPPVRVAGYYRPAPPPVKHHKPQPRKVEHRPVNNKHRR